MDVKTDHWNGPITEGQIKTIDYYLGEDPAAFTFEFRQAALSSLTKLEGAHVIDRFKAPSFGTMNMKWRPRGMTLRQIKMAMALALKVGKASNKGAGISELSKKFNARFFDTMSISQGSQLISYLLQLADSYELEEQFLAI